MMRSLSSSVAGLRAHQTRMDVIGNNIANVNTYGFKSSRTTFADVYYQTTSNGSSNNGQTGGTNPTQIGYGSRVASIDMLMNPAGAASTDRALDVYITGEGFLVTTDANGNYMYTRNGNLGFDAEGYLVDVYGNFVQGFPYVGGELQVPANGQATSTTAINVNPDLLDKLVGIQITTDGDIIATLEGGMRATIQATVPGITGLTVDEESNFVAGITLKTGQLPDSITGLFAAATNFKFGDIALIDSFNDTSQNPAVTRNTGLSFDPDTGKFTFTGVERYIDKDGTYKDRVVSASGTWENGTVTFSDSGKVLCSFDMTQAAYTTLSGTTGVQTQDITSFMTHKWEITAKDKGGNTQTDSGNGAGGPYTLGDIVITTNGTPFFVGTIGKAEAADGESLRVGAIVLAKFRNPQALEQIGNTSYMQTANSGEPVMVRPGIEGTGSLMGGMLEMSNVEIAKEFTDMITTQRGFQANSRIITVSDEMLQELVNLKR